MATPSVVNGHIVNWTAIASATGLLVIIVGAFWALAFGPIQEKFLVLQQRDNDLRDQTKQVTSERKAEIDEIRRELERRRDGVFVSTIEFKQVEKMVDAHQKATVDNFKSIRENYISKSEFELYRANIRSQLETITLLLSRIETTRPTTGELQAVTAGNKEIAVQLETRVRSLEDYIRAIRPQGALASPVPPR